MGENPTETITIPTTYTITPDDIVAHIRRVEMLCDLVTAMMKAMAQTPFAAMLPPEMMQQIRNLP